MFTLRSESAAVKYIHICVWRRRQLCFNVAQVWLHCLPPNLAACKVLNANCIQNSLVIYVTHAEFVINAANKCFSSRSQLDKQHPSYLTRDFNDQYDIMGLLQRWNRNVSTTPWWGCYSVVMLKPRELHFLSHSKLLSLSWEWTQEVEFSMATTEEWFSWLPQCLVLFFCNRNSQVALHSHH